VIGPAELEAILRAHRFLHVERPPRLWSIETDEEPFIAMLGEMLALALGPAIREGLDVGDLTLNVANVVADDDTGIAPPGEYVAVTVRSPGAWPPDDRWRAGQGPTAGALCMLAPRADEAGAAFAYTRALDGDGSVTALLPRADA